jgi:aerobic carbon-monoxide dehydrogenase medium subunit
MKSAPFEYYAPSSVDETLSLLGNFGDDAKLLAGGQSLVPLLALRLAQPSVLIDLNGVRELDYIDDNGDALSIGAMTRHRTLERSALARARCPLLPAGIEWVGHPQIRNRGTIGGSLVHADPAAELPALATALGATFTIVSPKGSRRTVSSDEFFVTYLTTVVGPDELLSDITLPALPAGTGWAFAEVARRHGDFALVGVAVVINLDGDGNCSTARIALFGVGETPVRSTNAEQALLHRQVDYQAITDAAAEVVNTIDPPGDIHASAPYRRYVATNLVRSALIEAAARAGRSISPL